MTWFTEGRARQGLFYARSTDGGRTFSSPMPIGEAERSPSRPFVLAGAEAVWMVWKEFDGEHTTVNVMNSRDDGKTWSAPKALAQTTRRFRSPSARKQRPARVPVLDDAGRRLPAPAPGGCAMRFSAFVSLAAVALLATIVGAATEGALHPFKRGSWQEIRRAHAGQPIVVHFWGLTCGPCRIEMPKWGRLLQERPDLRLIVIDADLIPNEAGLVSETLAKTGLTGAENWIFADDFVERLRFEIDPRWRGEIPMTLLIARDGKTTTIEGVADPAQVRAWLDAQKQ